MGEVDGIARPIRVGIAVASGPATTMIGENPHSTHRLHPNRAEWLLVGNSGNPRGDD
jgi:hypothetical protein